MDTELEGKVVMITGSTGGVGQALARAFAAEGCKLAISSRKQEKLDALVPTLGIDGSRLATFVVDVTDEEQVRDMVEKTVEQFGRLDVLVNNSGDNGKYGLIQDLALEDFMHVYSINVFGMFYGMKYGVRQMLEQGSGAVVNIVSEGADVAAAGMAPYVSSKHAAAGMSKCVALEVADKGIRVNCVCPGAIDTPMMRRIEKQWLGDVSKEEAMASFAAQYPDGKYADPAEVADLAVYLASARAGHINGACIRQDGGKVALA